jgi:hypothetical protein
LSTDRISALGTPKIRDAFLHDLGTALAAAQAGINSLRASSDDHFWKIWAGFCRDLLIDPWLTGTAGPILLLQVFAQRYQTGQLAPSRRPVKSHMVEGALCAVGQAFTSVGALYPHLHQVLSEPLTQRILNRAGPAPNRVSLAPIGVICRAANIAQQHGTVESLDVTNMICLAFFFLPAWWIHSSYWRLCSLLSQRRHPLHWQLPHPSSCGH